LILKLRFTGGLQKCFSEPFPSLPSNTYSHGQPQEKAPSPDEQAQAQKALEGQSPQKTHLAEVSDWADLKSPVSALFRRSPSDCGDFFAVKSESPDKMTCKAHAARRNNRIA